MAHFRDDESGNLGAAICTALSIDCNDRSTHTNAGVARSNRLYLFLSSQFSAYVMENPAVQPLCVAAIVIHFVSPFTLAPSSQRFTGITPYFTPSCFESILELDFHLPFSHPSF